MIFFLNYCIELYKNYINIYFVYCRFLCGATKMDLNLDLLCGNGSPNFSNLDLAKIIYNECNCNTPLLQNIMLIENMWLFLTLREKRL